MVAKYLILTLPSSPLANEETIHSLPRFTEPHSLGLIFASTFVQYDSQLKRLPPYDESLPTTLLNKKHVMILLYLDHVAYQPGVTITGLIETGPTTNSKKGFLCNSQQLTVLNVF